MTAPGWRGGWRPGLAYGALGALFYFVGKVLF